MLNHVCRGQVINITYSLCLCGLSHPECKANEPHYIVICCPSAKPYFSKLTHTRRDEFRPRQTRQLSREVDLKGRLLSCQSY